MQLKRKKLKARKRLQLLGFVFSLSGREMVHLRHVEVTDTKMCYLMPMGSHARLETSRVFCTLNHTRWTVMST